MSTVRIEGGDRWPQKPWPLPDRFFFRIGCPDERGCWPWLGRHNTFGYGVIVDDKANGGRTIRAHHLALRLMRGVEVPPDLCVDHICCNKACVNPAHLEIVTLAENTRRHHQRQAQCKHGHPWSDQNTGIRRRKGHPDCRYCRACAREKQKRDEQKWPRSSRPDYRRIRSAAE